MPVLRREEWQEDVIVHSIPTSDACNQGRASSKRGRYLGGTHVKVIDGAEGMVLYMPAECRHAAADVQPRHHHASDQLVPNIVPQN